MIYTAVTETLDQCYGACAVQSLWLLGCRVTDIQDTWEGVELGAELLDVETNSVLHCNGQLLVEQLVAVIGRQVNPVEAVEERKVWHSIMVKYRGQQMSGYNIPGVGLGQVDSRLVHKVNGEQSRASSSSRACKKEAEHCEDHTPLEGGRAL